MASQKEKSKYGISSDNFKIKPPAFHLAYLESIVENLPEAVAIFDHDGVITRVNGAFTNLFAYSAEEAIGQKVSDLLAHPSRREEAHSFRRCIKRGETINAKTIRRRKDGSTVNVAMKSAPVIVAGDVAGFFVVYRDITSEKQAEERLIALATTDSLTGLFNRRHFFELSRREFARSSRNGNSLVMLMIDIDHFKNINDTYGHQTGDAVLEALAALGKACIRSADIIGRIGGEEFTILLPETTLENGIAVAERFRHRVERMQIDTDDATITITVSIGVARASAGRPGFDDVLAQSDRALYKAKCDGRNRVSTWPNGNSLQPDYHGNGNTKFIAEKQSNYATLD
jgi:diguanylate cyclase (GGDEF)-like protein/PAS domain S-box-containing protein